MKRDVRREVGNRLISEEDGRFFLFLNQQRFPRSNCGSVSISTSAVEFWNVEG